MSLLEARSITKNFGTVQVLQGVDFTLRPSEIHTLLGQNGAGKSTLIKILTGVEQANSGDVLLNGKRVDFRDPLEARRAGIATVYQELSLVPQLSIAENMLLGRLPRRFGAVAWREIFAKATESLERVGLSVDPRSLAGSLPVAQQQLVEIARSLTFKSKVLILDEPTAAIGQQEVKRLFDVLDRLKQQGVGIIYISHRLDEVQQIASRVTVLRDGRAVYSGSLAETSRESMIQHMVGQSVPTTARRHRSRGRKPILSLRQVSARNAHGGFAFEGIDLVLHEGELLGITGPVGSGAIELGRTLFGSLPLEAGAMEWMGAPYKPRTPRDAIDHGIAFVSDDRLRDGLVGGATLRANISSTMIRHLTRWGWFRFKQEAVLADPYISQLDIQPQDAGYAAGLLSGGNQQKVVLAKWLLKGAKVVVLCEPTRGMDVEAKAHVYRIIDEICASGNAVLLISSEFEEVAAMSDRVLVMVKGRTVAELFGDDVSEEAILSAVFQGAGKAEEVQSDAS